MGSVRAEAVPGSSTQQVCSVVAVPSHPQVHPDLRWRGWTALGHACPPLEPAHVPLASWVPIQGKPNAWALLPGPWDLALRSLVSWVAMFCVPALSPMLLVHPPGALTCMHSLILSDAHDSVCWRNFLGTRLWMRTDEKGRSHQEAGTGPTCLRP